MFGINIFVEKEVGSKETVDFINLKVYNLHKHIFVKTIYPDFWGLVWNSPLCIKQTKCSKSLEYPYSMNVLLQFLFVLSKLGNREV